MEPLQRLTSDYPWIQTPLIVGAPMRLIALADLAVAVSQAGGIGFMGAGTDVEGLEAQLLEAQRLLSEEQEEGKGTGKGKGKDAEKVGISTLPLGVGFINWGADLAAALPLVARFKPAAVWFFAPTSLAALAHWTRRFRAASPRTRVWVQVGAVAEAVQVVREVKPDVLIVQGTDAGGHGLVRGAGIVALVPEVCDAVAEEVKAAGGEAPIVVAAGGIADARGVAAALVLGASGVVMGTRFLAAREAVVPKGYRDEVLRASDGGQTTVRTKVWDHCRGTTGWAETHNGRGIVNKTYTDAMAGMDDDENKKLYEADLQKGDEGWGVDARLCTYAGSAVGLVKEVKGAGEIVREVREGAMALVGSTKTRL